MQDLFPETNQILALLSKGVEQDLVILAVPSHDKKGRELPEGVQQDWHDRAMTVFAELYVGATSFMSHEGIYKDDEGRIHKDTPLIIESFARIDAIEDPLKLNKLVDLARMMVREMNQDSIMLVFGKAMFYIKDSVAQKVEA